MMLSGVWRVPQPPEIQEVGEGFGAAQAPEPEEGDARISDLARFPWAAAFEAGAHVDEDEVSMACHSLEWVVVGAPRVQQTHSPCDNSKSH